MNAPPGVEVHHTVTARALTRGQLIAVAQAIYHDHAVVRDWSDLFYGFLIGDAHTLEARGFLRLSGAIPHVTVALVGDFENGGYEPTAYQLGAVQQLRHEAVERGAGTQLRWHGQRDQTDCPGRVLVPHLVRLEGVPIIDRPGRPPAPTTPPPPGGNYVMPRTVDLRNAHRRVVKAPHVPVLQGLLMAAGYGPRGLTNTRGLPDGLAGAGTRAAVATYQQEHGLAADMIVGPLTWRKLIER